MEIVGQGAWHECNFWYRDRKDRDPGGILAHEKRNEAGEQAFLSSVKGEYWNRGVSGQGRFFEHGEEFDLA